MPKETKIIVDAKKAKYGKMSKAELIDALIISEHLVEENATIIQMKSEEVKKYQDPKNVLLSVEVVNKMRKDSAELIKQQGRNRKLENTVETLSASFSVNSQKVIPDLSNTLSKITDLFSSERSDNKNLLSIVNKQNGNV